MLSTIPTMRGWQARTIFAPAARRALLMNQANDSLSPTPVTRATLPVKSMGIIGPLLDGDRRLIYGQRRPGATGAGGGSSGGGPGLPGPAGRRPPDAGTIT